MVVFNTKKTKCMLFNSAASPIIVDHVVELSGKRLEFVEQFTYLGHIISKTLSDNQDIDNQNQKLCARGNMIARKFKMCSSEIKCMLFKTFCYTIYGSALWSTFTMTTLNRFRVNYNNILRRLFNVPTWNSASELFVRLRLRGFREQRRISCYSLMQRVLHSENSMVQAVVHSDARGESSLWAYWDTVCRG